MACVLPALDFAPLSLRTGTEQHGSCSSAASNDSARTVQHNLGANISTTSLSSTASYLLPAFRNEHVTTRSGSASPLHYRVDRRCVSSDCINKVSSRSRELAPVTICPAASRSETSIANISTEVSLFSSVDRSGHSNPIRATESTDSEFAQIDTPVSITDPISNKPNVASPAKSVEVGSDSQTFGRWLSRLRRRHKAEHVKVLVPRRTRWVLDDFDGAVDEPPKPMKTHRKSHSLGSTSLAFVTAVTSATITLASASIATVSRGKVKWCRGQEHEFPDNGSDVRISTDEFTRPLMDGPTRQRYRRRRAKIEELIRTEESYVADAYCTLLINQPTSTGFIRSSAQKTINDILQLHNDILGELYTVVPFAEYDQSTAKVADTNLTRTHTRWHSVDATLTRPRPMKHASEMFQRGRRSLNISHSSEEECPITYCSPQVAANVAEIFIKHIDRLSVYSRYGAEYEMIQRDVEELQRAIIPWCDYDRAIEILAAHVIPARNWDSDRKKAMTVKDLLIKPIQRIPRYELLFTDLCRLTPVYDDPDSYSTLHGACTLMGQTCRSINNAKRRELPDQMARTTWRIGERLTFSNQVPRSVFLQLLGPVRLCGCLFIAFRSKSCVEGIYVIAILFDNMLLLANVEDEAPTLYSTLAGVSLKSATIQDCKISDGLRCCTTPHAWKLVFERAARTYEMIFVACSADESSAWQANMLDTIERTSQDIVACNRVPLELHSPLLSKMHPLRDNSCRSFSMQDRSPDQYVSSAALPPTICEVRIINTQAIKDFPEAPSQTSLRLLRSYSTATSTQIPTLAPRRAHRQRLEKILEDVWTKDVLPYPGMIRRSTANHVMRKFSMASITSNFSATKRSLSYTSIGSWRKEDSSPAPTQTASKSGSDHDTAGRSSKQSARTRRPPLINFHSTPDAFLPVDFELENPAMVRQKKSALRTLTASFERPYSPLAIGTNRQSKYELAPAVREPGSKQARSLQHSDGSTRQETAKLALPMRDLKSPSPPRGTAVENVTSAKHDATKRKKSKSMLSRLFG